METVTLDLVYQYPWRFYSTRDVIMMDSRPSISFDIFYGKNENNGMLVGFKSYRSHLSKLILILALPISCALFLVIGRYSCSLLVWGLGLKICLLLNHFAVAFRRFIWLQPLNRDDPKKRKKAVMHVPRFLTDFHRPAKTECEVLQIRKQSASQKNAEEPDIVNVQNILLLCYSFCTTIILTRAYWHMCCKWAKAL